MSAKYTFYKNPPLKKGEEEETLYAKVVSQGRFGTEALAQEIADTCSFSTAVVKGMLDALSKRLEQHLKYGETVELEGIGTFSITLKCPKGITDPKQIRAESISFGNVVYRPSPKLKQNMRTITLNRATLPKRKEMPEEERLNRILVELTEKRRLLSSTDCMLLNSCSRYRALKDLKKLFDEDKLTRLGRGKQNYYVLREDWTKIKRKK